MAVWKRLWLVFAVIWAALSALRIFTIVAFGQPAEKAGIGDLISLAVAVPAGTYVLAWLWNRWRGGD